MIAYITKTYTDNNCTDSTITIYNDYDYISDDNVFTITDINDTTTITIKMKEFRKNKTKIFNKPVKVIGNYSKPFVKRKEVTRLVLRRG